MLLRLDICFLTIHPNKPYEHILVIYIKHSFVCFFLQKPTVRANESAATVLRSSKKLAITPPPAPTPPNPPKQNKQKPKPKASPSTPQSVQELLEQFPNNDAHDEDIDDEAIHALDDDDDHDNDSDYVATNNEFSDAEDMLEGIRGTVDKVVDTELGSDLNTKHEWFDSELAEEIIFSNADIEGQQDDDDDDDMDRDEGDVVEADTEANDESKLNFKKNMYINLKCI